ncbi:MAG: DUF4032 domain-containing protein [Bacillati bacterium ANGP1]|uniref:DUF4032 domain-containing protein n=1 Tax=Candidatus Segetimicrobium genomatis TaxID=2569760 RepID=A0A537LJM7_9BACT|nr:MAG: DUF4032 domain-containing protein [Terrabacteria group bacterium ANGP1]
MAPFKEFEVAQRAHGALAARPLGVIQVPVTEIVGSVGRARYFPRGLRPGRGLTPSRVRRLVAALNHGEALPPVLLYRLGHEYYIVDGHHRVAAAQLAGQQDVDAEVVAFLPEGGSPEDVVARERILFEQQTGITTIVLHEMGQYPKLLRWIEDFQRQRGRSVKGAARDWYAKVYLPAVDQLKERRLLRYFPGRSVGDLFVYLGDHKWIMSKAAGRDIGMRAAVDSFARYLATSRGPQGFARWLGTLRRRRPRGEP